MMIEILEQLLTSTKKPKVIVNSNRDVSNSKTVDFAELTSNSNRTVSNSNRL